MEAAGKRTVPGKKNANKKKPFTSSDLKVTGSRKYKCIACSFTTSLRNCVLRHIEAKHPAYEYKTANSEIKNLRIRGSLRVKTSTLKQKSEPKLKQKPQLKLKQKPQLKLKQKPHMKPKEKSVTKKNLPKRGSLGVKTSTLKQKSDPKLKQKPQPKLKQKPHMKLKEKPQLKLKEKSVAKKIRFYTSRDLEKEGKNIKCLACDFASPYIGSVTRHIAQMHLNFVQKPLVNRRSRKTGKNAEVSKKLPLVAVKREPGEEKSLDKQTCNATVNGEEFTMFSDSEEYQQCEMKHNSRGEDGDFNSQNFPNKTISSENSPTNELESQRIYYEGEVARRNVENYDLRRKIVDIAQLHDEKRQKHDKMRRLSLEKKRLPRKWRELVKDLECQLMEKKEEHSMWKIVLEKERQSRIALQKELEVAQLELENIRNSSDASQQNLDFDCVYTIEEDSEIQFTEL